jgi:sialic acid synthase SpsE
MYIAVDLHGQYGGKLELAERMLLECKANGAHGAKVQLYDPLRLNGNRRHQYLSLSFEELRHLAEYARRIGLEFFASFFDEERLAWCLELDFPILKVASTVAIRFPELMEKAVSSGRRTVISIDPGAFDLEKRGFPYERANVDYLYCVAKYPALIEDVSLPDFERSGFLGYSDHTIGTTACKVAIVRGARMIEKHYTISHGLQKGTEKAHAGSLTAAQLAELRAFSEEVEILRREGPAWRDAESDR